MTFCTRRHFLQAGLAALGAGSLAPRFVRSNPTSDPYAGFQIGLQTYTFRNFSAPEALRFAHELGVQTAEMFEAHFPSKSTPAQIQSTRELAKGLGIQILAFGVNPFTKDHTANRRMFEFAKAAGIRNLTADPTEDSFESLDQLVAEYDIRIAIHNHGPRARYNKIADVLNAIKGHHPNIGACADLGHYIRSGEDPVRAIQLFKGRLYGVHLKDFAEQKADAKGVLLGQGHLDVEGVFRALRQVDFPQDACLALEYEEKPENPYADVKECLAIASEGAQKSKA